MSSIPTSAMPHAGPVTDTLETPEGNQERSAFAINAERFTDKVRENPKTAMGVGAAVVAGAIAAAAIPLLRASKDKPAPARKPATNAKKKSN